MGQSSLSSTNQAEVYDELKRVLDQNIETMGQAGQLPLKAVMLYNNTQTLLNQPDAEEKFLAEFKAMTEEERNAYSHLRLVEHTLDTAAHILAHRNRPDDGEHNAYNIENMIELARQAGYTNTDIENFFADVRIWKAITPHPTEHLDDEGVELFRALVGVGEKPEEGQKPELEAIIKTMLSSEITPKRRMTTFEETDFALRQAQVYRNGQREMFRRVNDAVAKSFEGFARTPDLSHSKSTISTGMRVWHAGGDADGKANADRWALLHGMLSLTKGAVEDHLNDLNRASQLVAEDPCLSLKSDWQSNQKPFYYVTQALEELKQRIETLEGRFIDTDAAGNKKLKETADYEVIKEEFAHLYSGMKIGKNTFETRKGFEQQLTENFEIFADNTENEEAREIMQESLFLLRQYGLSAAIIETRHNGILLKDTMNNIFSDKQFVASLNLPAELETALQGKKMFTGVKNPEDGLSPEEQKKILEYAASHSTPAQRREAFLRANPHAKDGNGYTVQTHEIFERYSLMSLNPSQFGMAIIAEADEMSTAYQRFLAEPFGATTLLHTPLNEEYATIRDMPENMVKHHLNGGQHDISERALMGSNGSWYGHNMVHGQMVPCSDSGKEYGLLVRVLETEGFRQTTAKSAGLGIATLIKRGNGLSLERGGGDDMMYTRYMAQILREYAEVRGKPLDPEDPHDRVILQMATFFSNTEQGRAIRMNSSTPGQVCDDLSEKIGEMLGRRLELQGLVHSGTFIPPRGKYSPKTHKFLMETAYDMMQLYSSYRHAKGEKGEGNVIDNWATIVSDPSMAGAANSSARAQSKSSGKKSEALTAQRAIGSNIWMAMARTRHDGYFTAGEFLERMHSRYNDSGLSKQDVKEFTVDSQWWRRNFFLRALMPAVRSDMKHGFDKLGMTDMTFDRAVAIGKTVRVEEGVLKYDNPDGTLTDEQALQAVVFWDQVRLLALTEAGLAINEADSPYNKPLDELIKTVRPEDNSVHILPGKKTLQRWPQLLQAAESERQALPELVMADYYEDRIRAGEKVDDPSKRLVISAARAGTIPHPPTVLGREAYGRRKEPIWDGQALVAPPKNYRPELHIESIHEQPGHDGMA